MLTWLSTMMGHHHRRINSCSSCVLSFSSLFCWHLFSLSSIGRENKKASIKSHSVKKNRYLVVASSRMMLGQRKIPFFSRLERSSSSNQKNKNNTLYADGDSNDWSSMSRVSSSDSLNSVKSVRFGECEVRAYNQVGLTNSPSCCCSFL